MYCIFAFGSSSINKILKDNENFTPMLSFDNVELHVYYAQEKDGPIIIKSAISRTMFKRRMRDASVLASDKNRYLLFHFLRAYLPLRLFLSSFLLLPHPAQ